MNLSRRAEPVAREVRSWKTSAPVELRDDDTSVLRFHGEASVVDVPYSVTDQFGQFTETIARGAFDKTLSENPDVVFLINHEGLPLARTASNTMRLSATPHLTVDAEFDPSDPDVQGLAPKVRRGDVDQMSFAFRVVRQDWNDDYTERLIQEVSLHRGDVSSVTFGASPTTSGSFRSLDVPISDFDDALDAIKRGDATDEQLDLLTRAHAVLGDLLPPVEEERTDLTADQHAYLAAELAKVLGRRAA